MFITEEQAKQGKCIMLMQNTGRPMHPAMMQQEGMGNCIASRCVAYWKWFNPEHTMGYCAKAGRPEY